MRFREQQEHARAATWVLVALFALTVVLTVVGVNVALALAWRLQFGGVFGYPRWFFETNTAVTLGFVLGGAWIESLQLRDGGAHVAGMVGGREVTGPRTLGERRLRNIVDEMAIASGLPPLRVFVLDREEAINAFAAGWEPGDCVIAVTRGALERLTRDELEGVVAHEFAHVLNGDTRLNMRLIGMVFGLQMVFTFGRSLMAPADDRRRGPAWLAGLALAAAGSIGWFAGRLLKAGVSREREYLADASAVQFTRLPDGLGNALRKVAAQSARGVRIGHANAEMLSHLLLADAVTAGGWLATHPPLAERVRRIFGRDMAPLPAEPLPQEQPDATELPPLAFTMAGAAPTPPAEPEAAAAPDELLALAAAGAADRLEAAVLAFFLPAGEPGAAQAPAWRDVAGARADTTVQAVQSLAPARRLPWFEHLAGCAAGLPAPRRAALQRAARGLVQADGRVTLREYLLLRVLQRQLAAGEGQSPVNPQAHALSELAAAVTAVTLDLATLLPTGQRRPWVDSVLRGLALPPAPAGVAAPRDLNAAFDGLAQLARLQRPALVKQWLAAAPGRLPAAFAEAVRCLCVVIDTPLPPELANCFEPLPAPAAPVAA